VRSHRRDKDILTTPLQEQVHIEASEVCEIAKTHRENSVLLGRQGPYSPVLTVSSCQMSASVRSVREGDKKTDRTEDMYH
jgi:hypothetical protein